VPNKFFVFLSLGAATGSAIAFNCCQLQFDYYAVHYMTEKAFERNTYFDQEMKYCTVFNHHTAGLSFASTWKIGTETVATRCTRNSYLDGKLL